jgi:diguanylate cyclase (GGDEF)-like protein
MVDSVPDPMVVLAPDGTLVAANRAWSALADPRPGDGTSGDAAGRRYLELIGPDLQAGEHELRRAMRSVLDGSAPTAEVDIAVLAEEAPRWFAVRATPLGSRRGGVIVVHTDITDRKRSHEELELKASRDVLTGLRNRRALQEALRDALYSARADHHDVAALFIDLDGFKEINDTHGHEVGDEVLRVVARRLKGAVRAGDILARLGGDEFVVVITPVPDPGLPQITAERIIMALATPVEVSGQALAVRASIGIATLDPAVDLTGDQLLRRADRAMYLAKQSGGDRHATSV